MEGEEKGGDSRFSFFSNELVDNRRRLLFWQLREKAERRGERAFDESLRLRSRLFPRPFIFMHAAEVTRGLSEGGGRPRRGEAREKEMLSSQDPRRRRSKKKRKKKTKEKKEKKERRRRRLLRAKKPRV